MYKTQKEKEYIEESWSTWGTTLEVSYHEDDYLFRFLFFF